MNHERISKEDYTKEFVNNFHAENYDPADWVRKAKRWGMKYIVLTTRHHDGFALWDSKVNPYNAAKLGPKRDLLAPFADAVRAAGLKLGFYYSPASWTHPDYPGAYYRSWPWDMDTWASEEHRQRFINYYRAEMKELLTQYGKIDYLWLDGCAPWNTLDGDESLRIAREFQPWIITNNRLGKPYDVETCEQAITPAEEGQDWEACMTASQSGWGYVKCRAWKSREDILTMLLNCARNAGNLLINVGPKPDGTIPEEADKLFNSIGDWMTKNHAAIENSGRTPFTWNDSSKITVCGNTVYHTMQYEIEGDFHWNELTNKVKRVYALDTGENLDFVQDGSRLTVKNLTGDWLFRVIAIEVEGKPEPLAPNVYSDKELKK